LHYQSQFFTQPFILYLRLGQKVKNKFITLQSLFKFKKMATKKANNKITMISGRAKQIYKKGTEKWSNAISRATKELKKEGKI